MGFNLTLIGQVITIERNRQGLSQSDMAEVIHVNQSTISRIEKGDLNISLKHYANVLEFFHMDLHAKDSDVKKRLYQFYQLLDEDDDDTLEMIYNKVKEYPKLNVSDFYGLKVLDVCYYLYRNQTDAFFSTIEYLAAFEEVLTNKVYYIYLIMKGYYYHFKRDFLKANALFREAYLSNYYKKTQDNILLYIYAYNHIILKHYRLSHLLVMDLIQYYDKEKRLNKKTINERLLGLIYYFDGNSQDTIEILTQCLQNEAVTKEIPFLKLQFNSFIASSYLALKKYREAIPYLIENVEMEMDWPKTFYYAYLFYCLKSTKETEQYQEYKKKYLEDKSLIESHRMLVDVFSHDEMLLDYDLFTEHFNTLYQTFFQYEEFYQHTLRIYALVEDMIWRKRKYRIYKELNEVILKFRLGGVMNE